MDNTLQLLKNQKMLIQSLKGILPGEISTKDFSAITNFDEADSSKILEEFSKNGIGVKIDTKFEFNYSDRLKAGLLLLNQGAPLDDVAQSLDWKNFEGLVGEILTEKNFATVKNLVLTKPRMEIDVVGIRLGIAMLIDCKHWKFSSHYALKNAVQKQIERTKHYVSKTQGSMAVPVIVTLHADKVDFINKVPIVPIFQFSSFVDDFYGNLDQMSSIEKD